MKMLVMENCKCYNVSKKRKDKFKKLTMSLKSGLIIIILSILMTKIKMTSGRASEWRHRNYKDLNKLMNSHLGFERHSDHQLHKKYEYYNHRKLFERQNRYFKKPISRYPTLDKIKNRLDNNHKNNYINVKLKSTTSNPFNDEWEFVKSNSTFSPRKENKFSYIIDSEVTTVKNSDKVRHSGSRFFKEDWSDDVEFKLVTENHKGLPVTSKPWENLQRDIGFHGLGTTKDTNNNLPSYSSVSVPTYDLSPPRKSFRNLRTHQKTLNLHHQKHQEQRKQRTKEEEKATADAKKHWDMVVKEGKCKLPKAKVIKIHDIYEWDPSNSYSPHCAILHQCSEDTGCCDDVKEVCRPKNITKVELSFFKFSGNNKTVEKLAFDNHTECECQKRTEVSQDTKNLKNEGNFKRELSNSGTSNNRMKEDECKCPSLYSVRHLPNGTCICDCFDKQEDCLDLKRGLYVFSNTDKLCIANSSCLPPSCEYGTYRPQQARCPIEGETRHLNHQHSKNIT